ncbi:hypothetical protein CDV55_105598 [Aspergillus turcosus]|nr:hypothetical protein CDV55_105598 [Aspergillus turcosus]
MLDQEASTVEGGILANNCDLGKTLTALAAVYLDSLDVANEDHRTTLVLCPSTLIDTWLGEIENRFVTALNLYLFHGMKGHTLNFAWHKRFRSPTTQIRTSQGSNPRLAQIGLGAGLEDLLLINLSQTTVSTGVMASTVEAILSAVYLDSEMDVQAVRAVMAALDLGWPV